MDMKPGKRFRRFTSKQIASPYHSQSVTESRHNGCETPRKSLERLEPWLKLANLLPPAPLRDELKFLDKEPIALWQAQCRSIPAAEFLHNFIQSRLARMPVLAATVHLPLLRDDPDQAPRFLELVSEMALILQTLVTAGSSTVLKATDPRPVLIKRLYQTPATARSEIWMRNGALTVSRIDAFKDFLTVLDGVEAARLRQCPICRRFFYALRKDKKACSKRCNAARRVRDWRANQSRHEYQRKLRKAGLSTRRRKRGTK
jgi:hypothetical protein